MEASGLCAAGADAKPKTAGGRCNPNNGPPHHHPASKVPSRVHMMCDSLTSVTRKMAHQIAMPSIHLRSARSSGMAAPMTVDSCV